MLRPKHHSFRSPFRFVMHSLAATMLSNAAPFGEGEQRLNTESSPSSSSPPVLLLEGDTFQISPDGISRTLYQLESSSGDATTMVSKLMVEELYNIKEAKKTFVLREQEYANKKGVAEGRVGLGSPYYSIDLQELDSGSVGTLGTGVTTWETSIVMSLYFASNPEELSGHVLELGSGCGLGGILTQIACKAARNDSGLPTNMHRQSVNWIDTFSFTDYNQEILTQCQRNVERVPSSLVGHVPCHTKVLDWYEVASGRKQYQQYDVVIGSDCAYRSCDIEPLSHTIAKLVNKVGGRLHFFGPLNRAALHELLRVLRDMHGMQVSVESLEIKRYRLLPRRYKEERVADYASMNVAKFLHVVARHKCEHGITNTECGDLGSLD